jgi:hypothetical protein
MYDTANLGRRRFILIGCVILIFGAIPKRLYILSRRELSVALSLEWGTE